MSEYNYDDFENTVVINENQETETEEKSADDYGDGFSQSSDKEIPENYQQYDNDDKNQQKDNKATIIIIVVSIIAVILIVVFAFLFINGNKNAKETESTLTTGSSTVESHNELDDKDYIADGGDGFFEDDVETSQTVTETESVKKETTESTTIATATTTQPTTTVESSASSTTEAVTQQTEDSTELVTASTEDQPMEEESENIGEILG